MSFKERIAAVDTVRKEKEKWILAVEEGRRQEREAQREIVAKQVAYALSHTREWVFSTLNSLISLYEKEKGPVEINPSWSGGFTSSAEWTAMDFDQVYKARYCALEELIKDYALEGIVLECPFQETPRWQMLTDSEPYPLKDANGNWRSFSDCRCSFTAILRIL